MEDVKNMIQFIPCDSGTAGGSKRGSIMASFSDLKEMFGDPAFEGKGDNITTEFVIDYQWYDNDDEAEYGSFSLYDWHYGRNFGNDYEVIEWNIGGKNFNDGYAPVIAQKLFEKQNKSGSLVYAQWHELTGDE